MVTRIAAALALVAALAGCSSAGQQPRAEDDPGWNCHTQGNHICGPLGPVIHRVAVDPGQPQRGRWWLQLDADGWTWRPVAPNAAREAGLTRDGRGCYEHLGATSYAVCPEFWYSS